MDIIVCEKTEKVDKVLSVAAASTTRKAVKKVTISEKPRTEQQRRQQTESLGSIDYDDDEKTHFTSQTKKLCTWLQICLA